MTDTENAAVESSERPIRDEDGAIDSRLVEQVSQALQLSDLTTLRAVVADMHEADLGALLEALDAEERTRLISLLGRDFDFTALTEVDDSVREEILETLSAETVAEGVRDLDTDDAVYILEDLDEADKQDVLDRLTPAERIVLQQGLDYPEGSAGRRMQSEILAVPAFWTVGQTIDHLRQTEDLPERFFEILVADPAHHFVGSVPLDRLLRTRRPVEIATLVEEDSRAVKATDDIEDVARLFQRYNLIAVPVIDEASRLVGVITVDDIVDVIEEAADDDVKQLGGVNADEELSDPVRQIARSRFSWLFVNLFTSFLAAAVMSLFEAQLSQVVALAILAPVVASQGGNAATQTMTVAVRALATQELGGWNLRRFFTREMIVGLINGVGFALITGLVAALWFGSQGLGVVIAIAMVVNLLAAAMAGVLIPVLLDRFGIDPAVASGTFVTTVTDVVGFFSFLGVAAIWLAQA
ncbi:MAG: magnesium transporter [Bosea sp. (in: a-proteobacteria)]|jgi:magnesium transporter|uniref:magnesium transporter n=1 Tax=unclassified Bosea (in: a-proteobacteria) TaxID=2653178 RepID=UPI00083CD1B3|nr:MULTISPECIES: magnesium transporter [unclassified Bosea (in: a-proteobacteria)]AOG05182.1 magnesium transporter [Bosea sp. RAC05]MCZ8043038.1 magnesium transporter [Beijerinckiaceae bacterium]MDP3602550.1 magnesium transporter [Bosea sp. (in: a-proteobacteria)]WRH59451.1 MAG: magnesium transporter [Bosea sp. (in: a-proteobacteria)]